MKVSVVIPVWNGERYLRAALDSVFAQTLAPFEVIVADDGSTDATAAIAASYPVKVVSQPNSGTAAARNLGVRAARGDVIAMLDHDDLWLPEKLAHQVQALTDDATLDVVFASIEQFISEDTPEVAQEALVLPGVQIGPSASTLCARKSTFDRFGLFPLHHGDWIAWFAKAQDMGAQSYVIPTCLARRRIHETNLSRRQSADVRNDFLRLLRTRLTAKRTQAE